MGIQLAECLLLNLLKKKGMSQAEFARRLGVSRQYVRKLIIGERTMTLEMAINSSFILDCQVTDIYKLKFVSDRNE